MPNSPTIPLPASLKQKLKDMLVALALANLLFLRPTFDLLFDADRFYNRLPVTNHDLLALLVNILGAGGFIWLGMRAAHRYQQPAVQLILHLVFFSLLLIPADFIRKKFYDIQDYQVLSFFWQPGVVLCSVVVLVLVIWQHKRVTMLIVGVLGILSAFALVIVVKIILLILGVAHVRQCGQGTLAPLAIARPAQPRVIWMIFDELDYRLVFEERKAGLKLPEFERLEKETLHATRAYPPGDGTEFSMPPAILGVRAAVERKEADLLITPVDTGITTSFNGLPTVFSSARELGFNTALVGWYLPYDRLLSGQLNYCAWWPWMPFQSARGESFTDSLHRQFMSLAWPIQIRLLFAELCHQSLQAAITVSTNQNYGLTLLHLPPPHRPGIYSATLHRFSIRETLFNMSASQGYFNNLVLADDELGQIRRAMEAAGQWDNTWIIVSADHSWRSSDGFDGKRDLRVPFLVKPPGRAATDTAFAPQFNTILTHDLILAMLRGEVTNQEEVAAWLNAHRPGHDFIPGKMHE